MGEKSDCNRYEKRKLLFQRYFIYHIDLHEILDSVFFEKCLRERCLGNRC